MKQNLRYSFLAIAAMAFFVSVCPAIAEDDIPDIAQLREAAGKGDADAQFELATAYQKGEGVPQDDVQAVEWYLKAAEQGQSDAQFSLGFAYRGGFGVPKDSVEAYKWFDLSAKQGNNSAADLRSSVAELMTYDQIDRARKLSRGWKPKRLKTRQY